MKNRLMLYLCIAACLRWSVSAGTEQGELPHVPPEFPQFAFRWTNDPRMVVLERTGCGAERTAETTVFELIDRGTRLRKLSSFILKNPYLPLAQRVTGGGRFLVTIDQWGGSGTSDNCVVMYDSVFGRGTAVKLESFIPENVRAKLWPHPYMEGYTWRGVKPLIDNENLVVYPTSPRDCREMGLPFIGIDLRSQAVEVLPVPEELPPTVKEWSKVRGLSWNWSSGTGAGIDWRMKFEYPPIIKAEVRPENLTKEFLAFINFQKSACYQLDATTGDYIRCADDNWIDKKEEQNRPRQKSSD